MSNPMLTYSVGEPSQVTEAASVRDRVLLALAIADSTLLKSLLFNCTPPIAPPHLIGEIVPKLGVPLGPQQTADGILCFESIHCVLASSQAEVEGELACSPTDRECKRRALTRLTQCQSETRTLGQGISLAQALSLLTQTGFSHAQVETILNLSGNARHKSWWYGLDADGNLSVPFMRTLRTLRYTNGSFTLQYKDYFNQEEPPCFRSQEEKVLVEVKPESQGFSETLKKINQAKQQLGIAHAIVICDSVSDLEARGFIRQGISLYASSEIELPVQADCTLCARRDCPMQGLAQSPVITCRCFCLEDESANQKGYSSAQNLQRLQPLAQSGL